MAPGRSRIVIIGHLGFETVQTPFAQRRGPGGSAYYTALGAALSGGDVSLVSTVGSDFSLDTLREVGVEPGDLPRIAADTLKDIWGRTNPRPIRDASDVMEILQMMEAA